MRIVQLVTRLQRRGAEVFAAQLSDELAARGHDVILAGLYAGDGTLTTRRASAVDLAGRHRALPSRGLVRRVGDLLASEAPDVVQANGSDTLAYAALATARLAAPPHLVYRNIGMPAAWASGFARRMWVAWHLRRVDRVASVSAAAAAELIRHYRVPAARVTTIPRGTEVRDLPARGTCRARVLAAAGLPDTGPVLVHVGSFTPEKNHAGLLDAFGRVLAREPGARLVLIGDGPLLGRIRARIEERGWGDRVRLAGRREDADDLAGGADVFVLPSRTEGLPGVVLEAGARGAPSVAFDVGGVAEAIEDGRTGFVVPAGDLDAFAERIAILLADPARAASMGAAAADRVRARFDLRVVADAFERLYHELLPWPAGTASSI